MESLPFHLLEEILFKLDSKSLVMMQCAGNSTKSHVSNDPYFKPEYLSCVESDLLHMSTFGSSFLICHSYGSTRSNYKDPLKIVSDIIDSCSGLLLLFINGLCVVNPVTKRYLFLDHSKSKIFPCRRNAETKLDWSEITRRNKNCIGFTADGITQRFKVVCLSERKTPENADKIMYRFEINSGNSCWMLSESTITCPSSNLMINMKPVELNGSLHWLRNDGSIVVFDPETEQARLIPSMLPEGLISSKLLFAAGDNKLALISTTDEAIYVFTLKEIFMGPKWVLVKQIVNLEEKEKINVVTYIGKCLVVRDKKKMVHEYDLRANKWRVIGSIPGWCDSFQVFYHFKPFFFSARELVDDMTMVDANDDKRMSSLSTIMRLFSSEMLADTKKKKRDLRKDDV